jgi:hypothetical protein
MNQSIQNDIEERSRFYKKRSIQGIPQADTNFNIFQLSMNSRYKGKGIITSIFFALVVWRFDSVKSLTSELRPIIARMVELKGRLVTSANLSEIRSLTAEIDALYKGSQS